MGLSRVIAAMTGGLGLGSLPALPKVDDNFKPVVVEKYKYRILGMLDARYCKAFTTRNGQRRVRALFEIEYLDHPKYKYATKSLVLGVNDSRAKKHLESLSS